MKWLFAVFSLFVMLLIGLAVAPSFFDWNKYKEPILQQVAELTGHNVRIEGDISLALLPSPRVFLADVMVLDPSDKAGEKVFAAFKQLDVRAQLMPLFNGQVVVHSVRLEAPQVSLFKDVDGRFNFMTPKLEAMVNAKKALSAGEKVSSGAQKFAVSFEDISIENGVFEYREAGKKAEHKLRGVNLDVQASSLQGPFKAEGSLLYNDQPIEFEAKSGKIDTVLQSTSLNVKARSRGVDARYAGVLSFGGMPEAQGEISVRIEDLKALSGKEASSTGVSGALAVSGLLSANADKASLKNAELEVAGKQLNGAVDIAMKPLSMNGAFTGQDIVDLDSIFGRKKASNGGSFDAASLAGMLPGTLEIQEVGDIKLSLQVPGVVLNGQVLKKVQFTVQNTEKSFAGLVDVGEVPGQGRMQFSGALSFADKSKSAKTGMVIYSGPVAAFEIKGETQNLPVTVQAFTGMNNLPLVRDSKRGVFEFAGKVRPSGLSLDKGIINMDEAAFSLSGAFEGQKDTPRSLLKAKVVADKLDFDTLMNGSGGSVAGDPLAPLKTLALPFDVDLDLRIHDTTIQGHAIKGFGVEAALRPSVLRIVKAGADQFVGSVVNVNGTIGDLKNMAGLDIRVLVDTPDPYKLAGAFKVDTAAWPKDLGRTQASLKASGDLKALNVDASIKALGGEVFVKGRASHPLTQLSVSGLALLVKHPNMDKALQSFAPGAPRYASLSKPMDFAADVAMDGKVTSLSNIKADLAGTTITGAIRLDSSGTKPELNGSLRLGDLVLKSGKSGSSVGQSSAVSGSKSAEKWSSAPMDAGWLHAMNADIDVAANSILYETWDMKKPALKLTLQNGVMNIADLQAGLYDGQISAAGSVSSTGPKAPMIVKMASKIDNINMGALAKALVGSGRIQARGDVSFDFDVSGTGESQAALVGSLNGRANLAGNNVVMKGFDLAGLAGALMESNKPLPRVQQILNASTSSGETAFDTVKGVYAIEAGRVNITEMVMAGSEAKIDSKGSVNLPRWWIDTMHTVTLANAPDVDPFDVVIKGSLDNPSNTFGSGLFDTFVRQRLQQKVVEELPDLLGKDVTEKLQKFGVLPQKRAKTDGTLPPVTETEPASGEQQPSTQKQPQVQPVAPAPPPKSDEEKAQEAIQGLLKGLLQ